MAKKASVKDIINVLAKERGLEVTDLERIAGGGLKGRLESGAGFSEAFKETGKEKIQSIKKTFSKEGVKDFGKQVFKNFFSGDDIFSAYARGRLNKSEKKDEKVKPEKEEGLEGSSGSAFSKESAAHIQILAENTMSVHMMARDVNVMRQNLQELVKIWSDKDKKDKKPASKADIHFRSEKDDRLRLQSKVEKIRSEDVDYFAEQDKKEAELEASRQKAPGEKAPGPEEKQAEEKPSSFLDTIISLFSSGFMKAIKFLFNPKMLMKVVSKVFVPLLIISTIFTGIKDGFKKYQETGSFSEAIIAGLGGMLDFLTFGLFGEDTLRNLFSSISDFFEPITSTISGIFTGIKDFFKGLFGGKVDVKDEAPKEAKSVKPTEPSTKVAGGGAPGATPSAEGGAPAGAPAAGGLGGAPATAPPLAEGPSKPPKPTPVPAAATPPSAAPTPDGGESKRKESAKKFQEAEQARADVEALQMAEADLQGLHKEWRDEKGAVMEKLVNDTKKYPDGVDDDPKSPNYPKELKEIDEKYKKWIGIKKSEIENLKKKPGVKEELKRQKYEESRLDELDRMNDIGAPKKTPSKAGGTKFTTTEKVEVAGGGETTTRIAKTPEAKQAEKDLEALAERHAAERKEAALKARSEGKIKGRFATSKDFEEVGELKALKTKQEAERAELIKKIDAGTSVETTKSGGAGSAGGAGAAASMAPAGGGGGGAQGAVSSGGGAMPSMGGGGGEAGTVSAAGGGAPAAASTSPTPSEESKEQPSLKVPSGGDISAASSQVAEEQRMESAADQGSVVNAPTTNNNSGKLNQSPKQKSDDVYNSELVNRLAYS